MKWNSQRQSERYLQRLVEKGGLVSRLPNGEVVGRMVSREVARGKRKSPWQFKVNSATNCWEWQRSRTRGYGTYKTPMERMAHRVYYRALCGEIVGDLTLDHLCRILCCVNPAHLEQVTMVENVMRGNSPVALNARKTHCKYGHPFSGSNLVLFHSPNRNVGRTCRICGRNRCKAKRLKAKELPNV